MYIHLHFILGNCPEMIFSKFLEIIIRKKHFLWVHKLSMEKFLLQKFKIELDTFSQWAITKNTHITQITKLLTYTIQGYYHKYGENFPHLITLMYRKTNIKLSNKKKNLSRKIFENSCLHMFFFNTNYFPINQPLKASSHKKANLNEYQQQQNNFLFSYISISSVNGDAWLLIR